jgi:hypothetical protein
MARAGLLAIIPVMLAVSCGGSGAEGDAEAAEDARPEVEDLRDLQGPDQQPSEEDALEAVLDAEADERMDPAVDDGTVDEPADAEGEEGEEDAEVPPCTIAHPFDLSSLDGTNGFVFRGNGQLHQVGFSVSGAGDLNGDGYDDVLIGAPGATPPEHTGSGAGQTYVIFGSSSVGSGGAMDRTMLDGTTGFAVNGIHWGDESGSSVSDAGDVNGDGFDDIIIGAPRAGLAIDRYECGQAYVVYGGTGVGTSGAVDLDSLDGTDGVRFDGRIFYMAGISVSGAGDFNADGYDDVVIGAEHSGAFEYSAAYLVWGGSVVGTSGVLDLTTLDGLNGVVLEGARQGDMVGECVSDAGDVNGDGRDDILVSAPMSDDPTGLSLGLVYLIFGATTLGSGGVFDLGSLTSARGLKIHDSDGDIGWSVSGAGDVNGDGHPDIIIGGPEATPEGELWAGVVYMVWGGPGMGSGGMLDLSPLDPAECLRVTGGLYNDRLGVCVAGAWDINRDSFADVVFGANWADPGGRLDAGTAYLAHGGAGMVHSIGDIDGTSGVRFEGIAEGDTTGTSVSGVGDVNGDGWPDLAVGAPRAEPGGLMRAGEAYVIFGGSSCP